jgi:hexosaminidase
MENKFSVLILGIFGILLGCGKPSEKPTIESVSIIPKPAKVLLGERFMSIDKRLDIVAGSQEEKKVAGFLQEFLKGHDLESEIIGMAPNTGYVRLTIDSTKENDKESYSLSIDDRGVSIIASTGSGLFYGVQSLIQLFPATTTLPISIPFVSINDSPRFSYRGLHLDVGRHMFSVDFIKRFIDLMAYHKFNRFHWHLTEDQGWRIEIKKYPKLQELGAYRKETVVGHASTRDRSKEKNFDGKRYGGFYSQNEVRDIVKYATDHYVTIIPEIEMPGHSLGALKAYPELGCTGGPYEVATTWGVFDDIYCAGKEETFTFLEGVIDEVIDLFPGKYIHIGGDESPKRKWEKCPLCQKRIKNEKLANEHELQSYFVRRMEKYINSKGRQIIGWDEILEGGLAPNATVMSWRGEEGGIEAAKQNHDVVMTPVKWCYFDYYQDSSKDEPLAIGGYLPVSKVYSYEPIPSLLSPDQAKRILGVQGNLWTEYIPTSDQAEYMEYPRACALAEVGWSSKESRNYGDFVKRMKVHALRLDQLHVNYAKHILHEPTKRDSVNH